MMETKLPYQRPQCTNSTVIFDISFCFRWMNTVSDLVDMEQMYNSPLDETKDPFIFSAAASFSSAFVKFHAKTGELYAAHNSGGL